MRGGLKGAGGMGNTRGLAAAGLLALLALSGGSAAAQAVGGTSGGATAAAWRIYGLNSGRIEVSAPAGAAGLNLGGLAEQAWEAWRGPLALPDRWQFAIAVRLTPADGRGDEGRSWRVTDEPGGVVTVWIRERRAEEADGLAEDRRLLTAMAEGVLRRQAIFLAVAPSRITTPDWLAAGAAEAALQRRQPALGDAWQHAAAGWGRAPTLTAAWAWRVGEPKPAGGDAEGAAAAYGAWAWLQAEDARTGAWRRFLAEVLGGGEPLMALARHYTHRFGRTSPQELELAWQAGLAHIARSRHVPLMEPVETRRWLEQMDRVVLSERDENGAETEKVYSLAELWDRRGDAVVKEALAERSALLAGNFTRVHPFYRNAAGSLGRAWLALGGRKAAAWRAARDEWAQDVAAGRTLEDASRRILDGAGAGGR